MRKIVLASSSPYRQSLLRKLGLEFEAVSPDIKENSQPGERPDALAMRLALEKATAVAESHADALIIGSDQVAVLGGRQLAKPLGRQAAIEQLKHASGRAVTFHTGVCVVDSASGMAKADLDRCVVHFRTLADHHIEHYVDRDRPYDCAGSFKSEGLGIVLIERIEGDDPNALIGLPLIRLTRLLESFGVPVI